MVLTVSKFLHTKDIFREVTGADGVTINRTAWALDSKEWPTYMYFAIAAISLILNLLIMLAYLRDIRAANRAATIASAFTLLVNLGNVIVWLVSVVVYRYEKDTNGVSNDLWGWTCSSAAEDIQEAFSDVIQFNSYCNIQVRRSKPILLAPHDGLLANLPSAVDLLVYWSGSDCYRHSHRSHPFPGSAEEKD
jgi:hypothetical protein